MALNDLNKNAISFKISQRKAHTQQDFADFEEAISTNVSISYATIFGEDINPNPISDGGMSNTGDTDNIVERVKFEIDIISDTQIGTNQSQGYKLKLPAGYSGILSPIFSGGTYLYEALGKLQIVPSLYGELKGDGTTEYDPILYETDGITEITKFDPISWNLNPYNGILFVQDPPSGYDISASRPGYIEAFLFVGKYLDEIVITGGTGRKEVDVITSSGYTVDNGIRFIGASGLTNVNLPTIPLEGDEIVITDVIGTAETTPIIINGNGKNIIGDTTATIDTNYGSITLLYNGFFWSITAFTP